LLSAGGLFGSPEPSFAGRKIMTMLADTDRTTSRDGTTLAYDVEGSGPPLLLIAGITTHRGIWAFSRPQLNESFQTIAFDNRDAGAVLDAAGIERAHVLGHSMGGAIAQELALMAPERVDRLILANTWARLDAYATGMLNLMRAQRRAINDDLTFMASINFYALGGATLRQTPLLDMTWQEVETGNVQTPDGFLRQADACEATDCLDKLAGITASTLVLYGPDDKFFHVDPHARQIASMVPDATLVEIGCGHCPMIETPDSFVDVVSKFFLA
jgi:pimeloyl-ACP methyl ester carboxylesterase